FQTVIGLEIHAQLDITTKLFSGCPIDSSSSNRTGRSSKNLKPNTSVWPFDVGVPGFLPRLSEEAVRSAVLAAGAMKCYLPPVSRFERKHYFYADAPLGYQVTQQRWPIARDGILTCHYGSNGSNSNSNNNRKKKKKNQQQKSDDNNNKFILRIERIQLEQDTGKTLADVKNPITLRKESLVDFNRAGRALIEIVSHPDLRSSTEAAIAVETIRNLLKHIGTCDGKMEEGSLRCDLNVSIAPIIIDSNNETEIDIDGNDIISKTGNRVEVKNLNSIRQVQLAAEYEAIRQSQAILLDNSPTSQETRTFDVKGNRTVVIRTKEGAKDYRFMPEPDLPPLILNEETLDEKDVETYLDIHLPELPDDARQRLVDDYGLSEYLASVLTGDPPAIEFFDESISGTVANLLCNELFALVREFELQRLIEEGLVDIGGGGGGGDSSSIRFSRVTGSQLGEVVALLLKGLISNTMAKQLLRALYTTRPTKTISPRKLALERGFQLITDTEKLDALCRETIENSPREMERYKLGGKFAKKITKFLLGKAMGTSRGNAHPERLQEVLVEILN
ncbi:Glutamyl-tRNA amidotransferase B subunit, partial [Fragilariopsis cylindrus CCMP1102]